MGELVHVLRDLAPADHPDLIVGTETADDAAVWRVADGRAIVVTADFITPVVDDARLWGRVAAMNSVSDVYAMGGRPLLALNLVCWNAAELSTDVLSDVLAGMSQVAGECGFVIAGGHTVDDPEPKVGLAVIGEADEGRILRNSGLRPGDALVLTKPLGTGVVATALKAGTAPAAAVDAAVSVMVRSNAAAASAALASGATGATDVTGFGLLGHLAQMLSSSGLDATVDVGAVPLIPHARELAASGQLAGGSRENLSWVRERLEGEVDEVTLALLADAQTSGGLLFGAAPHAAAEAVTLLSSGGHRCALVGEVRRGSGRIRLR